jgi:hypothetical protein
MVKSYKTSVPLSLDRHHIEFIERAGIGKNFSDKARNIFDRAIKLFDVIAEYDGIAAHPLSADAILIYEETEEERRWADDLPFVFNKKEGWQKLVACAEKNKFICQSIIDESRGYIAIFIAPPKGKRDCQDCIKKIGEVIAQHV